MKSPEGRREGGKEGRRKDGHYSDGSHLVSYGYRHNFHASLFCLFGECNTVKLFIQCELAFF
jgi:hypothetical protein